MSDLQALWRPRPDDAAFWDHCRRGELRFQVCADCETARHPPHPVCAICGSTCFEYRRAPDAARLYSFTVVRTAAHPAFAAELPYCPAIVVFEGVPGVKLVTRLLDAEPERLFIGMALTLRWLDAGPELRLACFAPADGGHAD